MQEKKEEKLPLDAKLLSEAVIELNISRRSVGLYPSDHPLVKESIGRAFAYLQRLFAIRPSITLGIAGEALMVDEYKLESKNPVFREFANSVHGKGIAAITFSSGLTAEELTGLHELITEKDMPAGKALVEKAKEKQVIHITLSPLDFSSFRYVEGGQKNTAVSGDIWEDYIYGLLEGKLSAEAEGRSILLDLPPEEVAGVVNAAMAANNSGESYDRVITAYLQKKKGTQLSSESYSKFIAFIDNLSPELKGQFLSRSFACVSENNDGVETLISDMTSGDFSRLTKVFAEHPSRVPVTLKNFIDKLSSIKQSSVGSFDFVAKHNAVVDDVELDEDIIKIFSEDNFKLYVSEDYRRDLNEMLVRSTDHGHMKVEGLEEECRDEVIDKALLGVMTELFESDGVSVDDKRELLVKFFEYANRYIETGGFSEVLDIYQALVPHSREGSPLSTNEHFFHSEDFLSKFIDALRLYVRKEREGAFSLAKVLKSSIINPLIEALMTEPDAGMRKFFLSVLQSIGSDVNAYVVKKLNDKRWFVLRNMLYLLRECDGRSQVSYVRKFAKHENTIICIEAVKTLLHFNTPDAIPFLKLYLQSDKEDLRRGAVKLSGAYMVKEAVPYLVKLLEKKDIFGTESGYKMDVVRALGEIGDESAIKTLRKVCNARSLFYKGYLEDLKVELFRSLDNYSPDAIQELLPLGLRSDNEEIRAISERLMARESSFQPAKRGDHV